MKGFFYAYWFFEFGCDLVGRNRVGTSVVSFKD